MKRKRGNTTVNVCALYFLTEKIGRTITSTTPQLEAEREDTNYAGRMDQ